MGKQSKGSTSAKKRANKKARKEAAEFKTEDHQQDENNDFGEINLNNIYLALADAENFNNLDTKERNELFWELMGFQQVLGDLMSKVAPQTAKIARSTFLDEDKSKATPAAKTNQAGSVSGGQARSVSPEQLLPKYGDISKKVENHIRLAMFPLIKFLPPEVLPKACHKLWEDLYEPLGLENMGFTEETFAAQGQKHIVHRFNNLRQSTQSALKSIAIGEFLPYSRPCTPVYCLLTPLFLSPITRAPQ